METAVSDKEIAGAAEVLKAGELVAFPTETVYGLGADATSDHAVAKVYAAKGRPRFNPLITHVPCLDEALRLGVFNGLARAVARAFWPGPLTIVVNRAEPSPVSLLASAGLASIALRVPAHDVASRLLRAAGRPIVAPSANPSGRLSPTTAEHVRLALGGKVAVILDGGPCPVGLESTIIDCRDGRAALLRPGAISRSDIETELGTSVSQGGDEEQPVAPGQLQSHYAPAAKLRLNAEAPRNGEAFLAFGPSATRPRSLNLSPAGDVVEAAANLFRMLHALDAMKPTAIAVAAIPHNGLGEAINDRLKRAAAETGRR